MKRGLLLIALLTSFVLLILVVSAQDSTDNIDITNKLPTNQTVSQIILTHPPSSSIGSIYKTAEDLCRLNANILDISKLNKDLSLTTHECSGENNFKLKKSEGYKINIDAETAEEAKIEFQGVQDVGSSINLYNSYSKEGELIISQIYLPGAWNEQNASKLCFSIPEAYQIMQVQESSPEQSFLIAHVCNSKGDLKLEVNKPIFIISKADTIWNSLSPEQKPSALRNLSTGKLFLLIIIPIVVIIIFISFYYIKRKMKDEKIAEEQNNLRMMSN